MTNLVFVSYIIFVGVLFLSDNLYWGYYFFIYVTSPSAIFPLRLSRITNSSGKSRIIFKFSTENPCRTFFFVRSRVFISAVSFSAVIVCISIITPNFSREWLASLFCYLFFVAIFMLITARLATDVKNFYSCFVTILSLFAMMNAIVNIYNYFLSLPEIHFWSSIRMSPTFGRIPDHYITTGAMTYATCLVGAGSSLLLRLQFYQKIINALSAVVLFIAIFLTQSRGPLFGSLISLFIIYILSPNRKGKIYIIYPIIALVIFILLPNIGLAGVYRQLDDRIELWVRFLNLAVDRPFLGYGERMEIQLENNMGFIVGHAHNIFINAFLRGGVLGFIAYFFTYYFSLFSAIKYLRIKDNAVTFSLILLILISGTVDFDQIVFLSDWQWLSFWLPLGLAIAADIHQKQ